MHSVGDAENLSMNTAIFIVFARLLQLSSVIWTFAHIGLKKSQSSSQYY